ncbi:hypothetical protein [Endozoicomonas sp. ALB091]|uniref:hypothetical protein n=1 Tax=Endozoicomonas sp. ALB091 TaxID=3403073 RepID=UPI003BB67994
MSASASLSSNSTSLTGPVLDLYSANYNLAGVRSYGDGNNTEDVYVPLNRYPKYAINPDVTIFLSPSGQNNGTGSCQLRIFARKHDGTSVQVHALSLSYPRIYKDEGISQQDASNYTNRTDLLNYSWGTIEHRIQGYSYTTSIPGVSVLFYRGVRQSIQWIVTIDDLPFAYDANDYTGLYAVVSASDYVKQVTMTDVVASYL